MKRFLIVVDMQKDFVSGSLGSEEAQRIVPRAADIINAFDGEIIVTFDTHMQDYLHTAEGKKLPVVHCVADTDGWQLDAAIAQALDGRDYTVLKKTTFGSTALPALLEEKAGGEPFSTEFLGLCTDICVVSNALLVKAHFPEYPIAVHADACAGVTPESHEAALTTMTMCQIDVKREEQT